MTVAAAVMVMACRRGAVVVAIGVGGRGFCGGRVDVHRVFNVTRSGEDDGGPARSVVDRVLCQHHALQAHGRQYDDTQSEAELAKGVRQWLRLR